MGSVRVHYCLYCDAEDRDEKCNVMILGVVFIKMFKIISLSLTCYVLQCIFAYHSNIAIGVQSNTAHLS